MDVPHQVSRNEGSSHRREEAAVHEPLLVEVISEGPHCIPCAYAIAAVDYVAEDYRGRIAVRIVETKRPRDAARYMELSKIRGALLPVPSVMITGTLAFDDIPGPDELRAALDRALAEWEAHP